MTPTTTPTPAVGERVELGSYTLPGDIRRRLIAQRVNGVVRLADEPANPAVGRSYLIEYGLELDGYAALLALVADYLDQTLRHGWIPAADCPLERWLSHQRQSGSQASHSTPWTCVREARCR